jgi:hypothetical protein
VSTQPTPANGTPPAIHPAVAEVMAQIDAIGTKTTTIIRELMLDRDQLKARLATPLTEAAPALLALAHQYASECGDCSGTRIVPPTIEGGPDEPCEECVDIWQVIDRAEGRS